MKQKKDLQAIVLSELVLIGGIGRELYTAPFIWISADKLNKNTSGKIVDKFSVLEVKIIDKEIKDLEIYNNRGVRVFNYKNGVEVK